MWLAPVTTRHVKGNQSELNFPLICILLLIKSFDVVVTQDFTVRKAKLFYFYFFECDAAHYFNFIFVKTCDFSLQ